MARITLLTDFGTKDGYVGAMKGVIASILPEVVMEDVSHDLDAGDIAGGALVLSRYWDLYPEGTVNLVVVDPGVGTGRRGVAVEVDRRFFVAPDNGVLSRVLEAGSSWRAVEITSAEHLPEVRSRTFHGRDVFAPAAAHLARGVDLARLGDPVRDLVRIPEPEPGARDGGLVGEVVAVDRFGNLVTNVSGLRPAEAERVEIRDRAVPLAGTYGDVSSGDVVAVVNSDGRLEVAVRDGSAAELLDAGVGTPVRIVRS